MGIYRERPHKIDRLQRHKMFKGLSLIGIFNKRKDDNKEIYKINKSKSHFLFVYLKIIHENCQNSI